MRTVRSIRSTGYELGIITLKSIVGLITLIEEFHKRARHYCGDSEKTPPKTLKNKKNHNHIVMLSLYIHFTIFVLISLEKANGSH